MKLIKFYMKKLETNLPSVFSKLADYQVNLREVIGPSFYEGDTKPLSKNPERQLILQQEAGMALSPKEIEVVKLVLQGYAASAIAPRLFLAKRTIDHTLERIKEKLKCNSKTQLIQKARAMEEVGLFDIFCG